MKPFRIAASATILMLSGPPAQSEPTCGDLHRYLVGGSDGFTRDRGERLEDFKWKPRVPLPGGDCTIATTAQLQEFTMECSFHAKAHKPPPPSSYQSLVTTVQSCVDELESRDDWRKREVSPNDGVHTSTETTWTWTYLRNRIEQQIRVLNNTAGPGTEENVLTVIWRHFPDS